MLPPGQDDQAGSAAPGPLRAPVRTGSGDGTRVFPHGAEPRGRAAPPRRGTPVSGLARGGRPGQRGPHPSRTRSRQTVLPRNAPIDGSEHAPLRVPAAHSWRAPRQPSCGHPTSTDDRGESTSAAMWITGRGSLSVAPARERGRTEARARARADAPPGSHPTRRRRREDSDPGTVGAGGTMATSAARFTSARRHSPPHAHRPENPHDGGPQPRPTAAPQAHGAAPDPGPPPQPATRSPPTAPIPRSAAPDGSSRAAPAGSPCA